MYCPSPAAVGGLRDVKPGVISSPRGLIGVMTRTGGCISPMKLLYFPAWRLVGKNCDERRGYTFTHDSMIKPQVLFSPLVGNCPGLYKEGRGV